MDGEKIIRWRRKRSGMAEEIRHILREEPGGGRVPSKRFGADAAWRTIAVLALNLHNLMKHRLLPEEYGKSRPKSLRFLLCTMVGKIVKHGRRTILKIWTGDRGGKLFASVVKRLELQRAMPDRSGKRRSRRSSRDTEEYLPCRWRYAQNKGKSGKKPQTGRKNQNGETKTPYFPVR